MTTSPRKSPGKPMLDDESNESDPKESNAVPANTETTEVTEVADADIIEDGADDTSESTADEAAELTADEASELTANEASELTANEDAELTADEASELTADEDAEPTTTADGADGATGADGADGKSRRVNWVGVFAYGVLPGLALLLALAAGFLKWTDSSIRNDEIAAIESVQVAKDSTITLLTYQPATVEQQLGAARDLLTGEFANSYTSLVNDVVIPGAKQQQISATASVPGAASVSADPNHAVVLVFVNQTATVGNTAPTDTASSVRVTLDKVGDRWLISGFDPI